MLDWHSMCHRDTDRVGDSCWGWLCPLRRPSVRPGHALALPRHRGLLSVASLSLFPLLWGHRLSVPTELLLLLLLSGAKLHRPFSPCGSEAPTTATSVEPPPHSHLSPHPRCFSLALNFICLPFAWQLKFFLCVSCSPLCKSLSFFLLRLSASPAISPKPGIDLK